MKIVVYINNLESFQGPSVEKQISICRNYAKEKGYTIVGEYIDNSDDVMVCNRTAFSKMMRDSKKKLFHGVLFYDTEWVFLRTGDIPFYKVKLKNNGVKMLSVVEMEPIDPSSLLIESIMQSLREYLHEERSAQVKQGIRLAKERRAALAAQNAAEGKPAA